jgi:hypothetical protein
MIPKKQWKTFILAAGAFVVAIATSVGVIAAMDGGDDGRQTTDTPAGACLEGSIECDDIPGGGDAAGSACLEGAAECDDIPVDSGIAGGAAGGTCLVGTPDCIDTPGIAPGDTVSG